MRRLREALIGRFLNDAEGFEVNPHGMRRIGEPPVSERVCRQQVAEFIVDDWLWNRQDRQQRGSQRKSKQSNRNHRKRAVACKCAESALQYSEPA